MAVELIGLSRSRVSRDLLAPASVYRAAVGTAVAVFAAVLLWNAANFPTAAGYDVAQHQGYVRILVDEHRLPTAADGGAFNKPPLFYFAAAAAEILAPHVGTDAQRAVQYLNAFVALAAGLLVLALARLLWPERRTLHVGALAFFALVPVVPRMAASYHPASLALLASALSVYLAARMVVRRSVRAWEVALLTLSVVGGILTAVSSVWVYMAVVLTMLAAFVAEPRFRRPLAGALTVILGTTVLAAAPWFLRQADTTPSVLLGRERPIYGVDVSRRASFFFEIGYPDVLVRPYRDAFASRLLPVSYSELWGDYFGVWAWGPWLPEDRDQKEDLVVQNWLGLVPTGLALSGWLALAGLGIRRRLFRDTPAHVLLVALPALGLAGFAYYAYGFATPDGDTIKASYMTSTAPAWAIAFAFALDRLRGRGVRSALAVFLLAAALTDLRFVVAGSPLGGLL